MPQFVASANSLSPNWRWVWKDKRWWSNWLEWRRVCCQINQQRSAALDDAGCRGRELVQKNTSGLSTRDTTTQTFVLRIPSACRSTTATQLSDSLFHAWLVLLRFLFVVVLRCDGNSFVIFFFFCVLLLFRSYHSSFYREFCSNQNAATWDSLVPRRAAIAAAAMLAPAWLLVEALMPWKSVTLLIVVSLKCHSSVYFVAKR